MRRLHLDRHGLSSVDWAPRCDLDWIAFDNGSVVSLSDPKSWQELHYFVIDGDGSFELRFILADW
jgi:hypothetical protein